MKLPAIFISLLGLSCGSAARVSMRQTGTVPPDTTKDCTYYDTAYSASDNCAYFESFWGISHADFVAWNPSVKDDCSGIKVGYSYCVEVKRKTTTTTSTPTATASPKPSPTQPGLIDSCTAFYFAVKGDTCDKIVKKYGGTFTFADFFAWNPAVGNDCSGLWADTYYCVGIPGTPTSPPATITASPTGNPKPSPTQDGLIASCTAFYEAVKGDTCDKIVRAYGGTFTFADFFAWNPAVGSDCSGLWADTYYCVGIPGTPTSTKGLPPPTTTGNGITTPSPTQPGMIPDCNAFYLVHGGDTCQAIADKYHISLAQFTTWNPQVGGAACSGLWANAYVCVGEIGVKVTATSSPTTPTPTGGCATAHPEPTQPGSVCACRKWHQVVKGQYCGDIEALYGISADQFNAWNPQVGASCGGLWLGYYVCVSE